MRNRKKFAYQDEHEPGCPSICDGDYELSNYKDAQECTCIEIVKYLHNRLDEAEQAVPTTQMLSGDVLYNSIMEKIKSKAVRPTAHPTYGSADVKWLRFRGICDCDDYFLCTHRYDWLVDMIEKALKEKISKVTLITRGKLENWED